MATLKDYLLFCKSLDDNGFYKESDNIDLKAHKYAQTIDPSKVTPLDVSKTKEMQADPNKIYDLGQVQSGFTIGRNDPPQVVPLKDNTGIAHNILVLHGAPDGSVLIPAENGELMSANKAQFDEWRTKKGYMQYPWISCFNGNIQNSGQMNRLLRGTSKFELSTVMTPDQKTHLYVKSA